MLTEPNGLNEPFLPILLSLPKRNSAMVAVKNLAEYLLERLRTEEVVRVPVSEAEYLDIAPEFPR